MRAIRIGNDIHIKWWLVINGGRIKLNDVQLDIEIRDSTGHVTTLDYVVTDNKYIELDFYGIYQKRLGTYRLTAWINKHKLGQAVIDECEVFRLVDCSHEENGKDNNIVNTETISLMSNMFVGVSGLDIDENGVLLYNGKRYQLTIIKDEDGNGIPDYEDRLRKIEDSLTEMTNDDVSNAWNKVFGRGSSDRQLISQ